MTKRRRLPIFLLPILLLTLQPCFGLPNKGMLSKAPTWEAASTLRGHIDAAALAAPPNDNFADATSVNGNNGSVNGTNVDATKETGEPNHAGVNGSTSIWFQWQAPSPGTLTVTTAGSNFNTTLAVYTGTAVNALTAVGSNDDVSGSNQTSSVPVSVNGGNIYRIAVDGANGATGNVTLNWSFTTSCTYSFSPSSGGVAADATTSTVNVNTQAGCPWTAVSNNSYLTVTSGASGTGPGLVTYSLTANPSTFARPATLTIAGLTYSITQTGRQVTLSPDSYNVNETTGKVTLNVYQTGDPVTPVSVDYATADGTASRLKDYTQAVGTLAFAVGEKTKTVTVFVTNDAFAEPDENFTFTVSSPTNGTFNANVTIQSDDANDGPNPVGDAAFDADFFVRQHYIDFLGREADPVGLAHWTNEITQCGPDVSCRNVKRVNVSAAFFLSIEFQNTGFLAYRIFKAAYGDATSPNVAGTVPVIRISDFLAGTQRLGKDLIVGQTGWEQQLAANKAAYALEIVRSARFQAAFPFTMTAGEYVDKLRANTGSALSQAEYDQLVAEMATNNTSTEARRASVLRKVAEDADLQTAEFNRAFVLMEYFGYLRRNPDEAPQPGLDYSGWKFWLDKLEEFNGNYVRAELVNAFITSLEYRQRFGP